MKLKLLLPLTIGVLLAGTVWVAAAGETARQTGIFSVPQEVMFDDVDVRDNNNNLILDAKSQQDLKDVFQSGLFSLLINSELYTYARAAAVLAKKLGLGAQALHTVPAAGAAQVLDMLCNVGFVSKLFVVLLAVFMAALCRVVPFRSRSFHLPSLTLIALAPVSLRC